MQGWVVYLMERYQMSERKVCETVKLPRQSYQYKG